MSDTVSAQEAKQKATKDEAVAVKAAMTADSFQNFMLNLGIGTDNPNSAGTYGFNPITKQQVLLEWMHRGSWVAGIAVDVPADDMSRAGIEITSGMEQQDVQKVESLASKLHFWSSVGDCVRWARLYGGAIAVHMVDGQDVSTALRIDSIGPGQYRGLMVFDRWQLIPSLNDLVDEQGPSLGLPKYYTVSQDAPAFRGKKIHYSRVIRMIGIKLPYRQALNEDLWGISVLERLHDRMIAFDSASTGAAQLVYKSYLRTLKLAGFRNAVAAGGDAMKGVLAQVEMMRRLQSQEGISIIDSEDEFQLDQASTFSGIADAIMQFGQQLAGALQMPMVRMFGQSPAGLNSSGESDLRTYYDGINSAQKRDLNVGVDTGYRCMARSEGVKIGESFGFEFSPLWLLTENQKTEIGDKTAQSVSTAYESGIISLKTAMTELRESSRQSGMFSSITPEMIDNATEEVPEPNLDQNFETVPNQPDAGEKEDDSDDMNGENKPQKEKSPKTKTHDSWLTRWFRTKDELPDYGGLPIVMEQAKGQSRNGRIMAAGYGFVKGTVGADGDCVDVFLGPEKASQTVWVISQLGPDGDVFEQHKCMMGFTNWQDACAAYLGSFLSPSDTKRLGDVKEMTMEEFKKWLYDQRSEEKDIWPS